MDFLNEFDKRAKEPKPERNATRNEHDDLFDFADRIRSTQALPTAVERERIFKRVKASQRSTAGNGAGKSFFNVARFSAAAAILALAVCAIYLSSIVTPRNLPPTTTMLARKQYSDPIPYASTDASNHDDFSPANFPAAVLASAASAQQPAVEVAAGEPPARALRVHGLVAYQPMGETRWHVLKRGQALQPGDTLRASLRLESSARVLAPDGSAVSIGPGTILRYSKARDWRVDEGAAQFEVASRPDLPPFVATTPDGTATALGTVFAVEVSARNASEPKKDATRCTVGEGRVEVALPNGAKQSLSAKQSAFLNSTGIATAESGDYKAWLAALENEMNSDRGIGQLVAKTEKANEHLPLEIVSHSVSVACVDQVARTFVDEVFANNTDNQLEGIFYYPLPADAAISEFAMYIGGKRVVGEVLEQQKARQVFEYIVRQQKDPALLEWAGGNIFKMRVFPIEAHSQKRVQLGYTQILPRRSGSVTYTYPLYSEMLLKNPLLNLNIEFRVLSNAGLSELVSPTHVVGTALDPDGKRGTLAFHAQKYSPTRDFSATYKVPGGTECIASANAHPDDDNPYFMLQLCPKAALPARKPPERLLVIVDGSASSGAQDYAVATEFAASCADVSSNWKYGLLRGGQNAEVITTGAETFTYPDATASGSIRDHLAGKPALGATDLLATFAKAADLAADGKGLQIVYIGDGIDTLNELSGPALVEKIAALFKGKNVNLSTVALGSSYERPVLQGLASALGGTFTRVEGAADVHAAVDQVFDGFYRPQFWNARVKIDGVDPIDMHSETIGTLAAGGTAIVLARFKSKGAKISAPVSYQARATFTAEIEGGTFEREYPLQLILDQDRNAFIPRLWARAHNEALMAQIGLGSPSDDARLKRDVIAESMKFQIMSPYTSFLVLEEKDYERYGIKRTLKRVDWMGAMAGGAAQNNSRRGERSSMRGLGLRGRGDMLGESLEGSNQASLNVYFGISDGDVSSSGLDGSTALGDLNDWGEPNMDGYFAGGQPKDKLALSSSLSLATVTDEMEVVNGESLTSLPEPMVPVEFSFEASQGLDGEFAGEGIVREKVALGFVSQDEGFQYATGSADSWRFAMGRHYRGYSSYPYFASAIFPYGTSVNLGVAPAAKFEFTPDQPLKSAAYYQRIASRKTDAYGARMNWVLSLEAGDNLKHAQKELQPLLTSFPNSVELKLENGSLQLRLGEIDAGMAVLDAAVKSADEKTRAATTERAASVMSSAGQFAAAAQRFAELARAATTGDDAARLGTQATSNWPSAMMQDKCAPFWEEMLTRWPENPAVNSNAAQWLMQKSPKDQRGMNLLRKAAPASPQFAAQYIAALIRADRRDDVLSEARKILDATGDQAMTYSVLGTLAQIRGAANAESKRILKGGFNSGKYMGIAQYWSTYSVKNDKELTKLLADGLGDPGLSAHARTFAAHNLASYSAAGMTPEKMAAMIQPLASRYKTDDEFAAAYGACILLQQRAKYAPALDFTQALLKNPALKEARRFDALSIEFEALTALHREDEFFAKYAGEFFGDNPTSAENGLTWAMSWKLNYLKTKNDVDGAAERLAWFAKRFPESKALPELTAHVRQIVSALKKPEERAAAIERLAKKYPENAAFGNVYARSLAQNGKFREAAESVRASLNAIPPTQKTLETKAALLALLAQLSAQDATLRDAFLKEAEENSKTEDAMQLEWTEAALTCLHAAGDLEKYSAALLSYVFLKPNDPEWAPRLGSALLEMQKYKEALAVFEALSNASPDDSELAFTCQKIALKLKDAAAAQAAFDRAFEALAAQPNKLMQFANNNQQPHPDWALKAYARLEKDPVHFPLNTIALQAGNVAKNAGKLDEAIDWYFKALFAPDSYYVGAAATELASFAQQEAQYRKIDARAREVLDGKPEAQQAVAAHLLLSKLRRLQQDPARARAEIEAALKLDLPISGYSYTGAALIEAMANESMGEQMEKYVLNGGDQDENSRGQLIRTAISHSSADRAVRLYRALLKNPDGNEAEDRRQLAERLIQENQLDAAATELRKDETSESSWSAWSAWERLISAYENKHDEAKAFPYALAMWEQLKDDPNYGNNALRKLTDVAFALNQKNKLDADGLKHVVEAYRYFAKPYFSGDEQYRWQAYNLSHHIEAFGLKEEFDDLAKQASASGDVQRILAAARYLADYGKSYAEARICFERALAVEPANREALQGVYDIVSRRIVHQEPADWNTALKMLDALEKLEGRDLSWLKSERIRCLHALNRMDDARAVFHELEKVPGYIHSGYWNMKMLAQECESARDYPLAIEVWELALRTMRAQTHGHPDMNHAAEFYSSCAKAYAQSGEDAKALDCLLRGMSLIPRNDSHYKIVLQAAIDTVLRGKLLTQAVAAHENNVKADGNDKPHLRIAFAEAFKKESKTREMLEQLRYAADLLPKDMSLRKEVIEGYTKLHDTDAAIDEYRRWAALDPQNIDLYRGWGDLYESLGQRANALLAWATMVEVRPREAEGYRAYAQRLSAIGEHQKAASAFRQALKYRPTEYDIAKELSSEYVKTLSFAEGNARIVQLWADGAAACRKAMEDVPDDPQPWLNLGRFLEAQHKPQEARELYKRIIARPWPRFQHETMVEARKRLK